MCPAGMDLTPWISNLDLERCKISLGRIGNVNSIFRPTRLPASVVWLVVTVDTGALPMQIWTKTKPL